ncbi:MAG: glutathione S-transferase N-terminal domain-containing protein [Candidatus Omnitrophica bacterium]|nr:glutathione S-transferase N-terminal domain-containing protein [Candidatus Omnitrophota bacterium]
MIEIKIYSTPTCPYCTQAKQYLSSKGLPYENIDVSADQEKAQEMVKLSGQMGVPVLVIGGTVVTGFDKSKIDLLVK